MPDGIFAVAWILMALGYTYSGVTKLVSPSWRDGTALAYVLDNPLARPSILRDVVLSLPPVLLRIATWGALAAELSFAPLALIPRVRSWIWTAMLLMHVSLMALLDFADLSLGMLMLQMFTFNPAWVRPRPVPATDLLFYDGNCGLCHRAVRFVLAEDSAAAFRFAPLDSDLFRSVIPAGKRNDLPDSFVILTVGGVVLTRSAAVRYLLARLGGIWRLVGGLAGLIPTRLRDVGYNAIARFRSRLFARPAAACPVLPVHLRDRFAVPAAKSVT